MNKDKFLELYKQYSRETVLLSFLHQKHPAYVELLSAGEDIVPWLFERLKDFSNETFIDQENDPWLSINLIHNLAPEYWYGWNTDNNGQLTKILAFLLDKYANKLTNC